MTPSTALLTPRNKAYRCRVYPTKDQITLINQTLGCCRKVYNLLLAQANAAYDAYKASLTTSTPLDKPQGVSKYDLANLLPTLKLEFPFLYEVSSVALQQTALNLGAAYSRFFSNIAKRPRFKKYGTKNSFQLLNNSFKLKGDQLFIAKSKEPLRVRWSQELPSAPSSITISRTPSGKYFAVFLCEVTECRPVAYKTETVGVDLGLTTLAILSTGTHVPNPKNYKKHERKLARLQKHASRKKKGSSNRRRIDRKIARLHEKIANLRKDHIEKATTSLVENHKYIALETLKVTNMVKNHCLAKGIQDASWGMFRTRTIQKVMETQDSILVMAHPFYASSKLCSCCNRQITSLALSTREWECPDCGTTHNRDLNAAFNLENILDLNMAHIRQVPLASGKDHILFANQQGYIQ